MFCSKCGTETPDDSQFCRKCGHALSVASSSTGAAAAVAPAPIAANPKSRVAIWFLLPLPLLVLWWAATSHSPNAQQLQQLAKPKHTQVLENPALTINATGSSYFKLDVPPGVSSAHLQGGFTASGGSGNDVEAYVFSEDDFVNWQNGHPAKTYYNSGKVTVGNISVNLPADAGTYYLVFDNRFSLLSTKVVRVNATLTYYQ